MFWDKLIHMCSTYWSLSCLTLSRHSCTLSILTFSTTSYSIFFFVLWHIEFNQGYMCDSGFSSFWPFRLKQWVHSWREWFCLFQRISIANSWTVAGRANQILISPITEYLQGQSPDSKQKSCIDYSRNSIYFSKINFHFS